VRNVVVSDVFTSDGTVDYFKYDPDGDAGLERPEINFTIEDEADAHEYEYIVYMRESIPTGWTKSDWEIDEDAAYTTGHVTAPGSVEAEWNGAETPKGDPDEMPAGVYTFDIFVKEYDDVDSPERERLDAWIIEVSESGQARYWGLGRATIAGADDLHCGSVGSPP